MSKEKVLYHEIYDISSLKRKRKRLNAIDTLFMQIKERFREFPRVEYLPPNEDRFSIWRLSIAGWHYHYTATEGSLHADGQTLEKAAKKLLSLSTKKTVRGTHCKKGCLHYFDDGY